MKPEQVRDLYDDDYASLYDERFLLAEWPKHGADFEASLVGAQIGDDAKWLDVGCGTGYFLSLFPGIHRAGIDISPAMVERARRVNPDAAFIDVGDFRSNVADWHGKWTLVTCMWTAYNYVESMSEIEILLENFARWTAPGGTCFIPVMDLEDIRPFTVVPYRENPEVWGGSIAVTGVTWTWEEATTEKVHTHLVAPQVGFFVERLSESFEQVEVVRYPPFQPGWVSRKAVLATRRRGPGDAGKPATTIWHPRPSEADHGEGLDIRDMAQPGGAAAQRPTADLTTLPARTLARELVRRSKPSRRLWRSMTYRGRQLFNRP